MVRTAQPVIPSHKPFTVILFYASAAKSQSWKGTWFGLSYPVRMYPFFHYSIAPSLPALLFALVPLL